jgi:hypothetical protein
MNSFYKKIGLFIILGSSSLAQAKIVYYGSETESLPLVYGSSTIIRFTEDVKTISQASKFIIEPSDATDPNYKTLTIKPRYPDSMDKVTFILSDDSVVSLKIMTVAKAIPEKTDNFFDLRPKEQKIDPESAKGADITELELMKAMIRTDNLVGYNAQDYVRAVRSGIDGISAQLVKVYTGPKFNGYIFQIVNNSSGTTYVIDLKSLTLGSPNQALLSQVDERVLQPKGTEKSSSTTYLRIVAKPTSVYSSVALPIAPIAVK